MCDAQRRSDEGMFEHLFCTNKYASAIVGTERDYGKSYILYCGRAALAMSSRCFDRCASAN